jgi:hypothetical protein
MDEQKRSRRGMIRSPNFPTFSLKDAIDKADVIWKQERRSPTTADVIQKHLGYTGGTGPGKRALSALRQFGLLEDEGGNYRLSERAVTILNAPAGSGVREQEIEKAAQGPTIYAELLSIYPDGLPSDDTLKSHLITKKGFNPSSVTDFIATFKETIRFARLAPGMYDAGGSEPAEEDGMPPETEDRNRAGGPGIQVFAWNWSLNIPRNVRADLRLSGRDLKREDIDRLRKQLDFLAEAFEDSGEGR